MVAEATLGDALGQGEMLEAAALYQYFQPWNSCPGVPTRASSG